MYPGAVLTPSDTRKSCIQDPILKNNNTRRISLFQIPLNKGPFTLQIYYAIAIVITIILRNG